MDFIKPSRKESENWRVILWNSLLCWFFLSHTEAFGCGRKGITIIVVIYIIGRFNLSNILGMVLVSLLVTAEFVLGGGQSFLSTHIAECAGPQPDFSFSPSNSNEFPPIRPLSPPWPSDSFEQFKAYLRSLEGKTQTSVDVGASSSSSTSAEATSAAPTANPAPGAPVLPIWSPRSLHLWRKRCAPIVRARAEMVNSISRARNLRYLAKGWRFRLCSGGMGESRQGQGRSKILY